MTQREHRKTIAMIFFVLGVLNVLGWIAMGGWQTGEWMFLLYSLLFVVTGWTLHNRAPGARLFGIIACLICIPSFPIGTIIGIYGMWYFWLGGREEQ